MISLAFLKYHRIAIFGTGFDAAKCMFELQQRQIVVENFFNNRCQVTSFCGRPVYEPSAENMKGIFTIIATAENTFLAISEQLRNMELREFEDFIFYPLIDRKMVLLHGNCHMSIVKEYLESCEYFNKEYNLNDTLKPKLKGRNIDIKVSDMDNYTLMKQQLEKNQQKLEQSNKKLLELKETTKDVKNLVTTLTSKDKYILKQEDKDKIINFIDKVDKTNNEYQNIQELSITLTNVDEELKYNR